MPTGRSSKNMIPCKRPNKLILKTHDKELTPYKPQKEKRPQLQAQTITKTLFTCIAPIIELSGKMVS